VPRGRSLRRGAGALAAIAVALASHGVDAAPLMPGRAAAEPLAARMSLLHRVLIYAKQGSGKLLDGRWTLSQAESKLGIALSADETNQLMACTGKIVCSDRGGEVYASASSVLRPDLLVTAKHVFAKGRGGAVSVGRCSFRSFLHRNAAIPLVVEKDQRKGYFLNNEDFIVVRLKRELKGCEPFALDQKDSFLSEGEEIFSATAYQRRTLNKISSREPVLARGAIRSVSTGLFGGPPFYYGEIDLDEGGSGGAVFALKDGRPVADDDGRLILRGLLVAHGPNAKDGQPYSEDRNYTIVIGLQEEFRDLVAGKASRPVVVEQAQCLAGGAAKITVIAEPVPAQPEPLAPFLQQDACDSEAGEAKASCTKLAQDMKKLARGMETLAASSRRDVKQQFKLKNDTGCPVCFTYERCNEYGCWDEAVRASGKSTLFAGVSARAPVIKNPQFCASGPLLALWRPPLPLKRPTPPPPLPSRKPGPLLSAAGLPEAMFLAVKEKARRDGVWTLTEEDIRGLSLEQLSALRGY
jgi:trypsin-like peptidase